MATDPNTPNIPLPTEGQGSAEWWNGQCDWSAETRKELLNRDWRRNANAYRDRLDNPTGKKIRVNVEFEKTEQKRHQLFYRLPQIKLRPHPRTTRDTEKEAEALALAQQQGATIAPPEPRDLKRAVSIFREVLSMKLGPEGANLKPTMDEMVFDVLCPSGIAFMKVGYERHTEGQVPLKTGAMIPDPNFEPMPPPPGAILDLNAQQAPMVPETVPAPNVVFENYYGERISPAQALIPMEFRGSDYSGKAKWLGWEFPITEQEITARGWPLSESDRKKKGESTADDDDSRIVVLDKKGHREPSQHKCREIFYYAHYFDAQVKHPKKIRHLVFVDGEMVCHEDYRDQKWDARGRLIGGLEKLPIKVLTLRYISDYPYPPSDCTITRRLSDELSEFRSGQALHRRKAVPRVAIDITKITNEKIKKKIEDGKHYDDIPVDGRPDQVAAAIAQPAYPSDNWLTDQRLQGDVDRSWSLGVGANAQQQSGTTATEVAAIERATSDRMEGEREKVVSQFFVNEVVTAFAQLIQLYADQEDYVEIVGEEGAKEIAAWDKNTIAGKWLFEAVPDSSLPPDAKSDREDELNWHNLTANDPYFDPVRNRKQLAEAFGRDPGMVQQPPAPAPEPPKPPTLTVTMNLADLMPGSPLAEIGMALLQASELKVQATSEPPKPEGEDIERANVVDRDRMRMAQSDQNDQRAGGLVGVQ